MQKPRLDRDALSPFLPATLKHGLARPVGHAAQEPVHLATATLLGLVSSLWHIQVTLAEIGLSVNATAMCRQKSVPTFAHFLRCFPQFLYLDYSCLWKNNHGRFENSLALWKRVMIC